MGVIKIELTEKELRTIIDWHRVADCYWEERGVYMGRDEAELLAKLESILNRK